MQELPRHRGCAALMSHSQPKIWRKIQKIGGDISPASLAFRKYGNTRVTPEASWTWTVYIIKIITININILKIIIISSMMMMISGGFSYGGFSYSYILCSYFGCMPWWWWRQALLHQLASHDGLTGTTPLANDGNVGTHFKYCNNASIASIATLAQTSNTATMLQCNVGTLQMLTWDAGAM